MNSPISVKPIDDGLDLEQPFDEREVRDSECLVYETKLRLPNGCRFRFSRPCLWDISYDSFRTGLQQNAVLCVLRGDLSVFLP